MLRKFGDEHTNTGESAIIAADIDIIREAWGDLQNGLKKNSVELRTPSWDTPLSETQLRSAWNKILERCDGRPNLSTPQFVMLHSAYDF